MLRIFWSFMINLTLNSLLYLCEDFNYGPPSRSFSEESYTVAVLNSTHVKYEPGGPSILIRKSDEGKFGEFHVSETSGVLVHVESKLSDDPHTACYMPLQASYGEIPKNERWIALVKRGKCNFQTKVENAYYSNASGIIIYNDKPTYHLEKMRLLQTVPKEFSAVFTHKWKGQELYEIVDNGSRVFMEITVGDVYNKSSPGVNRTSVLFVSVSFIVLMMVSLGWIIFYYVQKCRYLHAKDRLSKRLTSAAKKALQKIPTRHIKPDEKDGCNTIGDDTCAICIELFKPADIVRLLPCRHEFHKCCIDPWLLEHRTCPMCKMDILKYFGFELTGSQESMLRMDQEELFTDIFNFEPDPENLSTIVEAIVPVTINHQSRSETETRPSTSGDGSNLNENGSEKINQIFAVFGKKSQSHLETNNTAIGIDETDQNNYSESDKKQSLRKSVSLDKFDHTPTQF